MGAFRLFMHDTGWHHALSTETARCNVVLFGYCTPRPLFFSPGRSPLSPALPGSLSPRALRAPALLLCLLLEPGVEFPLITQSAYLIHVQP